MNYYNEIKTEILNNEITKRVKDYSKNKSDLTTYYNVGKLLSEAGKHYGEGIIKEYSEKLENDINLKYTERTLRRIRQFYLFCVVSKWSTLSTKLTWSHFCELLKINNTNEIKYYITICEQNNLSVRQLRERIKNKEYERLDEQTKLKIINEEKLKLQDTIKNPIIIKNNANYEVISEKVLQKMILEDIEEFMKELGNSFSFVGSEYPIKICCNYNYIDLLLYNYEFNCFVVVELKVTKLKKEYIGQIEVYMNYVDRNLRNPMQDKTIGIILCRKDNKFIIEYCSDERIKVREYSLA
jgi:predicted nuclease of restriction endonuclease-like (RecB) superfamily